MQAQKSILLMDAISGASSINAGTVRSIIFVFSVFAFGLSNFSINLFICSLIQKEVGIKD